MGRYFGREPRYSRQELEQQAQAAIDARVSLGRPPEEEFRPIQERLAELDQVMAARPPAPSVADAQPLQIHQVHMPKAPADAGPPAPGRPARKPVAARSTAN